MAGGSLEQARILEALDTGLYIGNLWYLNYSDMPAARLTGMTRFATFWVENGQIRAPVSTMRFDDSLYSFSAPTWKTSATSANCACPAIPTANARPTRCTCRAR